MRTTDQSHAQFAPTAASDSDSERMRRSRLGPSLQVNLFPRVNRVGTTLRGIPRLLVLRRAFCLSWAFSVVFFIYIKWHFALYLSSTLTRNTLEDFGKDWCRVRRARIDWGQIQEPCDGNTVYDDSLPGWNVENRTDSLYSLLYAMDIRPAGEFSQLTIKTRTSDGDPKMIGGDYWRVFIDGPSGLAPTVIDHGNGSYEVLFLIVEHGEYCMYAVLDHSLCDGMKDPPDYWYKSGNVHGSNQPEGILGGKQVYLMSPLRGGQPICFNVPPNDGPMRKDEFLRYGFGLPSYCGLKCKFLSDGFGYWINDSWKPYTAERLFENSPRRREGVLWIYGDSLAVRFHASISKTPLCTEIFKQCNVTYNWVYNMVDVVNVERNKKNYREFEISRVLHEISMVIHRPEMDEKSVIILNCGLHYVSALQFSTYKLLIDSIINLFQETTENQYGDEVLKYKGKLIWKTTTAIHRERFLHHNHPSPRFLTLQRIQLYNAYSTWAMCNAGFEILDVYPMSASYPEGTDDRFDKYDAVHFKTTVFKPAEQLLFDYFHPSDTEDSDHSSHSEPELSQ